MLDQHTFMETVALVKEVMRTSPEPMEREAILSYFQDMELNKEQENMVLEFLLNSANEEEIPADSEKPGEQEEPTEAMEPAEPSEIATTGHFQMYLDEVASIKELDVAVEEGLYQALLKKDTSVIGAIATQWLKPVITIAEEYQDRGYPLDDLVQEGNMGLLMELHAIAEDGNGDNIVMRLHNSVREAIELFIGEEYGEEQQNETILGKVSLVHAAMKFLTEEKGTKPSMEELASYTKISLEEIRDILSLLKED